MSCSYRTIAVGRVCQLVNGRAFKPSDWGTTGLPIIRIQNLNDGSKAFNFYEGSYNAKHSVQTGDVLLSWSGTPGTSFGCFLWDRDQGLLNQHIFRVLVDPALMLPKFFLHAMNSRLEEMIALAHGAAGLRHITKSKLEQILLPLPALVEQERIASWIDNCFDRVDEMELLSKSSRAERNHLSASVIESILHPSLVLEAGWGEAAIGDLVVLMRNGRSIAQSDERQANGAVLTLTAVRGISLATNYQKCIDLPDSVAAQYDIDEGDVFVSRANTIDLVGLSAVAEKRPDERLIYPDLLIKLKADRSKVLPRYLAYALRSASARRQIRARALGASQTMVKISGERLREVVIPVPSLAEQDKIVSRLDSAHELIGRIAMSTGGVDAASVRASVLRRAFLGAL